MRSVDLSRSREIDTKPSADSPSKIAALASSTAYTRGVDAIDAPGYLPKTRTGNRIETSKLSGKECFFSISQLPTTRELWRQSKHQACVLRDHLAGNRIGRAFDVDLDQFDGVTERVERKTESLRFRISSE